MLSDILIQQKERGKNVSNDGYLPNLVRFNDFSKTKLFLFIYLIGLIFINRKLGKF